LGNFSEAADQFEKDVKLYEMEGVAKVGSSSLRFPIEPSCTLSNPLSFFVYPLTFHYTHSDTYRSLCSLNALIRRQTCVCGWLLRTISWASEQRLWQRSTSIVTSIRVTMEKQERCDHCGGKLVVFSFFTSLSIALELLACSKLFHMSLSKSGSQTAIGRL
jgi:hypothetical protein